jgi:hypothetical protein
MCIFPIATEQLNYGKQNSTCVSFLDINDTEVGSQMQISTNNRNQVKNSDTKSILFKCSDTENVFLIDENGNHSLNEYSNGENLLSLAVSSVISKALQNSIQNTNSKDFKPITIEYLTSDIKNIMLQIKKGKTPNDIMQNFDKELKYGNSRKMSKEEINGLDNMDKMCDKEIDLENRVRFLNTENNKLKEEINAIGNAIENNCSEITQGKIKVDSRIERGMGPQWGMAENYTLEQISNANSDKEMIAALQKILCNVTKKDFNNIVKKISETIMTPKNIPNNDSKKAVIETEHK